jgi:hypothetical protein
MSAALAAEGHFQPVLPDFPSFSAASLAIEGTIRYFRSSTGLFHSRFSRAANATK